MTMVLSILGTSYTGSTLLAFLLEAHPGMGGVSEATGPIPSITDLDAYLCSCGETLPACPFWRQVFAGMAERGHRMTAERWETRFELGGSRLARQLLVRSLRSNLLDGLRDAAVRLVPRWRRRLWRITERNAAFFDTVLEITGATVFVDASKDPQRVRYLGRHPDLDLWTLHLVRDAPGFVSSAMRNDGAPLGGAVRAWLRMARQVERTFRILPAERVLRVRYEELCADPRRERDRIAAWLRLPPGPAGTRIGEGEHHMIGHKMRLEGPREIVLNERWRQRLTPGQLRFILAATRRTRRRLGYPEQP